MSGKWSEKKIRDLVARLEDFRRGCRVTTLVEEQETSSSPYRLLVACIISLRTKDEVTAEASKRLFTIADEPAKSESSKKRESPKPSTRRAFTTPRPVNCGRSARSCGTATTEQVPANEEDLLALPGVGRKTANLVLGLGFGVPAICVDTHVHRISNRLGMVQTPTPEKTEFALQKVLPEDLWIPINDLLVTFGQNQCHPTSPRCSSCPIEDLCPRVGVTRSR